MKIQRNGQASVLTDEQFQELMSVFSLTNKLLFGICYYTSCRIREALQLSKADIVGNASREVRQKIGDELLLPIAEINKR